MLISSAPADLWIATGILAAAFLGYFGFRLAKARPPRYEKLLLQREQLEFMVTYWRYLDGLPIPQHKREPLLNKLHEVARQIEEHPDRPDRSAQ